MTATVLFSEQTVLFVLLGMASGAMVALVALGVVLVHRASGVLNFSAGSMGAIGAFLFYTLRDEQRVWWLAALSLAIVAGAASGVVTHLALQALTRASAVAKVIATLGLMSLAQGFIAVVWGVTKGQPEGFLPTSQVQLTDDMAVPMDRLILIAAAVVLTVGLRLVYSRTLFGLATSGVAESPRVAASSGWSPSAIALANFVIAGVLSTVAAVLLAPIVTLHGAVLTLTIVPALAAALVGRFSSFTVTVVAALVIGVLQSELSLFRADIAKALGVQSESLIGLPQVAPLLIIILVTVVSGRSRPSRGEVLAKLPSPGSGQVRVGLMLVGGVAAVVSLFSASPSGIDALVVTFATGVLLFSVVVVTGYGGQLSLCQFALAGFGAWVASRLVSVYDVPFELAMLAGILGTVPLALVVGLPALRTRGVNLAIITMALALMIGALVFNNGSLTGGYTGTVVPSPEVFGIELDPITQPERYGAFALGAFVLVGLVVANVRRGRAGLRLLAVRSNERAAASLGVGVFGAKLYAFGLAGAIAAVGGVLIGFRQQSVDFEQFDVLGSVTLVLYAVVGGVGWASGAIAGAMLASGGLPATLVKDGLGGSADIASWLLMLSGILVVVWLWRAPDGVASLSSRAFRRLSSRLPAKRTVRSREVSLEESLGRTPLELEVRAVSVTFGGVRALEDVSFTVGPGEVVGLMGPNGAGKTTMVDVVTGFTRATSGSVLLGGREVGSWSPERRARAGMARSWQGVDLFDEMTVRENLLVAADRHRRSRYLLDLFRPGRPRSTPILEEVVEEFGLADHLHARPRSLSQGAARLVGIARAIVTEPAVLLLDEPAAGLDTHEAAELGAEIRRVANDRGVGVLLIEHDVPLMLQICDRIVVLDFGRQLATGTPEEISRHAGVIGAYLGTEVSTSGADTGAALQEEDPSLLPFGSPHVQ